MENNVPIARRSVERALEGRRAVYAEEVRRLVETAFVLIQEQGDLEPRVSAIVQRAGLSNQAFYRHFHFKHELLVEVLDEGVRMLASYLAHRMAAASDPQAQVRAWLLGMLEQALDTEAAAATRPFVLARGRLSEILPREVAASEGQLTVPLRKALTRARQEGALPGVDPERDAETLYHLAMGWMQARLQEARPGARVDAQRLVEFAMHGLQRPSTLA